MQWAVSVIPALQLVVLAKARIFARCSPLVAFFRLNLSVVEFIIDFDVFFFFVVDFGFGHFSHVGAFGVLGRGHFGVHVSLRIAAFTDQLRFVWRVSDFYGLVASRVGIGACIKS